MFSSICFQKHLQPKFWVKRQLKTAHKILWLNICLYFRLADKNQTIYYSAWLVIGLFAFFTIEKVFPDNENESEALDQQLNNKHAKNDMKKKIFLNTIKVFKIVLYIFVLKCEISYYT